MLLGTSGAGGLVAYRGRGQDRASCYAYAARLPQPGASGPDRYPDRVSRDRPKPCHLWQGFREPPPQKNPATSSRASGNPAPKPCQG